MTLEELEKHASHDDCWICVHGIVMDITKFLNEHPGGPDIIVNVSGRDCTVDFEDIGHTDGARSAGNEYIVGRLEGYENVPLHVPTNAEVKVKSKLSGSYVNMKTVGILGTVGVGALAALYAIFLRK